MSNILKFPVKDMNRVLNGLRDNAQLRIEHLQKIPYILIGEDISEFVLLYLTKKKAQDQYKNILKGEQDECK